MPLKSRKSKQTPDPTFVFKGAVRAIKSATMKQVPVDDRTLVVTVDQILEAPPNLSKLTGQKITVRVSSRKKIKVGQEMIFHAVSWIYGDSVAVQSLKEEPVKAEHMAMLAAPTNPVAQHHQRLKEKRFRQAALVVSGKVISVRIPSETQNDGEAKASVLSARRKPISEHDPKWREALIEVNEVHKGEKNKKQVVVRFPASKDVMWYHVPKFEPGQQGYFMLHKPKRAKTGRQRSLLATAVSEPDVYTVLDPEDFQPFDETGGVHTIIESSAKKKRR
jgi:hypothetical protein